MAIEGRRSEAGGAVGGIDTGPAGAPPARRTLLFASLRHRAVCHHLHAALLMLCRGGEHARSDEASGLLLSQVRLAAEPTMPCVHTCGSCPTRPSCHLHAELDIEDMHGATTFHMSASLQQPPTPTPLFSTSSSASSWRC